MRVYARACVCVMVLCSEIVGRSARDLIVALCHEILRVCDGAVFGDRGRTIWGLLYFSLR